MLPSNSTPLRSRNVTAPESDIRGDSVVGAGVGGTGVAVGALVVGGVVVGGVVVEVAGAFVVVAPVVEVGRGFLLVDVTGAELGPLVAALPSSLPPHATASMRTPRMSNRLDQGRLGVRSSRVLTTLALHHSVGRKIQFSHLETSMDGIGEG